MVTSVPADAEPRAPRHAAALARHHPGIEVIFVDSVPKGYLPCPVKALEGLANLTRRTHVFPHRRSGLFAHIVRRLAQRVCRALFRAFGFLHTAAIGGHMLGLETLLVCQAADVYLAHNMESLLPTACAARRTDAALMFDCMEFYSELGDDQTREDSAVVRALEGLILPRCALVLASSDQVADAYEKSYGIRRPMPLYNVPPLHGHLPPKESEAFALYWRSAVVGFGQRGLEDALSALALLPAEISLHLQGRLPGDGGKALRAEIQKLGLTERVIVHPPHLPHEAVLAATKHTVGLCLERDGVRNQMLTVSNKMFDYLMAGLPVIASDLPGLRAVIERSSAGLVFRAGHPEDLARAVLELYGDPERLRMLAANARRHALTLANQEAELAKFCAAFDAALGRLPGKPLRKAAKTMRLKEPIHETLGNR